MKKPVYLGLSILGLLILDLSTTLKYEVWYDYVKPTYGANVKLCHMNTESFIVHVKTYDIHKDIAEDVETRFATSNFELDKRLPKGKNKNVIRLMKDELFGQILKELLD